MAEFRVPFAITTELPPPFQFAASFDAPNGSKRILFNTDNLQVVWQRETISSEIGDILAVTFHVVGTIEYICNAYPITVSNAETYQVYRFDANFNGSEGNRAYDCVDTTEADPLGWLSACGCKDVDVTIGATTCFNTCQVEIPSVLSVGVADFAVDDTRTSTLTPTCGECGEEEKRVVKWRGCFVITTDN